MHTSNTGACLFAALLTLSLGSTGFAQELADYLEPFEPLLGQTWLSQSSAGSEFEQLITRWEPILHGRAIRETLEYPKIGFVREVVYYWDPGQECLAHFGLTSNGILSRGQISIDDRGFTMLGESCMNGQRTQFKHTVELRADGKIDRIIYHFIDGSWQRAHDVLTLAPQ